MKKILKQLWAIQMKAFEKGVFSFEIDTRYFDDGDSGALVYIYLEDPGKWVEEHPGEESNGKNYLSVSIYGDGALKARATEWQMQQVRTVADFVGVEV